jgi:hypothetical protein
VNPRFLVFSVSGLLKVYAFRLITQDSPSFIKRSEQWPPDQFRQAVTVHTTY